MYTPSLKPRVLSFRNRAFVWIILTTLLSSFLPSVSLAQQPTATISSVQGTVLVNGQEQAEGMALNAGDIIETQAGSTLVLELSDGSVVEIGENTQINLTQLAQTAAGARISRIKLLWGRIRAVLAPGHQQTGSSFDIETPNALLGVTFSQPDIEVSYSEEKAETIGIAHTVELLAKNLVTNEEVLVPVGSSVIIVGTTVKIIAGILVITGTTETATAQVGATKVAATGTEVAGAGTSEAGSSGLSTGTKITLGVGAAAAAGGIVLAVNSGGNSGDDSVGSLFRGVFKAETNFVYQGSSRREFWTYILNLSKNGDLVSGSHDITVTWENCCTVNIFLPVTGTIITETSATLSWPSQRTGCSCATNPTEYYETGGGLGGTFNATLEDDGQILQVQGFTYNRQ
jgi:hypothetical protein